MVHQIKKSIVRYSFLFFLLIRDSTLKNNLRILRRAKAPLVCSLFSLPPPSFICHRQRSASSPERVFPLRKQSGGLFLGKRAWAVAKASKYARHNVPQQTASPWWCTIKMAGQNGPDIFILVCLMFQSQLFFKFYDVFISYKNNL